MKFKLGFEHGKMGVLVYSIFAIALVAALSSEGVAFAAASTTTTTSTASQSSSVSQSSATASGRQLPENGSYAGNGTTAVTGMPG